VIHFARVSPAEGTALTPLSLPMVRVTGTGFLCHDRFYGKVRGAGRFLPSRAAFSFVTGQMPQKDNFSARSYAMHGESCFWLVRFLPQTLPKRFTREGRKPAYRIDVASYTIGRMKAAGLGAIEPSAAVSGGRGPPIEVVVETGPDDVAVEANRGTRGVDEVDCAGSIQERNQWAIGISHGSEVIKEIFGLRAAIGQEHPLDAAARGPAAVGGGDVAKARYIGEARIWNFA
jgi:hypothetical protein